MCVFTAVRCPIGTWAPWIKLWPPWVSALPPWVLHLPWGWGSIPPQHHQVGHEGLSQRTLGQGPRGALPEGLFREPECGKAERFLWPAAPTLAAPAC